jgi:DNA polymerase III sliding clamp (beta) subunit (PCNA family)
MGFLEGKVAIITGGGRAVLSDGSCGSIGYGIATAYAKEGANLVLTGRNVQKLDDAKEEIEVNYEGNEIKIGFNAKYITDILNSINDDMIDFELNDHISPGLMKPHNDSSYLCVVMPMRI